MHFYLRLLASKPVVCGLLMLFWVWHNTNSCFCDFIMLLHQTHPSRPCLILSHPDVPFKDPVLCCPSFYLSWLLAFAFSLPILPRVLDAMKQNKTKIFPITRKLYHLQFCSVETCNNSIMIWQQGISAALCKEMLKRRKHRVRHRTTHLTNSRKGKILSTYSQYVVYCQQSSIN